MDRELSPENLSARRRRRGLRLAVAAVVFVVLILGLRRVIEPSVDRDEIRTAVVERGEVVASISASGQVVPAREQLVSALFTTEIVDVLVQPGAEVEKGAALLRLDSRDLELELSELTEQLALAGNQRDSRILELEKSLDEARSRHELLGVDLESRQATLSRREALAADGLIAEGELLEAQLNVKRTMAELEQLERVMTNAEASAETALERIDLETSILRNQLDNRRRLLSHATVSAPRHGVVTWLVDQIGASIVDGAPLARVADLSAFRVEAGVSDFYASQLRDGLPARVVAGDDVLEAEVEAILPTVEGGSMKLLVKLAEPGHPILRPRLRVDVEVVTGSEQDALGLRNGPALGANTQFLYRIEDGWAIRTPVELGLASRHRVQVLDGLQAGDEVIISDTRELHHLDRFRVE